MSVNKWLSTSAQPHENDGDLVGPLPNVQHCDWYLTQRLSDAHKRRAGTPYVFPFCSSKSQKFEAVVGSSTIPNTRRQSECARGQRNLQVNCFTHLQVRVGARARAALTQINTLSMDIGSHILEDYTNSDLLVEQETRKATPHGMIHVFQFSAHRCVRWDARRPKSYPGIGNQA